MEYEVEHLVIGAGIAGSAFGLRMLRAGKDVLLADGADRLKRNKLCGGLLGQITVNELKVLLGDSAPDDIGLIRPAAFKGISSFGTSVSDSVFGIVERKRLDDYCFDAYVKEGGKFLDRALLLSVGPENNTAVFLDRKTNGTIKIRYRFLTGADGALSTVRRLVSGRRQRILLALQGTVEKKDPEIVFESLREPCGYLWYIPYGEKAVAGCLYQDLNYGKSRERLEDFCNRLGYEIPRIYGAYIPSGDDVLLRSGKNVYYIGDAAGLADGFSGGGIHYALISAGRLSDSFVEGKDYEALMSNIVDNMYTDYEQCKEHYEEQLKQILIPL